MRLTRSITALAVTALAAGVIALPATAQAKNNGKLHVQYDAAVATTVVKTNSTLNLASTLTIAVAPTGKLNGHLPLPSTESDFTLLGFLPAHATVTFIERGKVFGKLKTRNGITSVTSQARYVIQLSDVTVGGIPAFVGNSCETAHPVDVDVATAAGQSFSVTDGGTLSGTFTIGDFTNCGLSTTLLNALIPGPDNTISLTLANGRAAT